MPDSKIKMVYNYGLTAVYSGLIIGFGTAYKRLILYKVDKTNHQYQKSWDDQYIVKLFTVNFINFYCPMLLVAFYT
jgi:predicted histidine transporter YuiF (NhaC family)